MKDDENTDDTQFIDEDEDANPAASLKRLRERLKKAVAEKQEYLDGWQRSRAEFTNYKRQEEENRKEKAERSKAEILEKILPALDALELARRHHAEDKNLAMLERQFLSALKDAGIEQFGSEKGAFDPRRHDSIREIETDVADLDHTVEPERSGYAVGDTVIRPAQVAVYVYKK